MSFREVYGGQDKPKGRRYRFKDDWKRQATIFLIIRPSESDDRDAMNAKYAERKRNPQTGGWIYPIPNEKDGDATKYLAARIWMDIENGYVVLGDEEAAEFYSSELNEEFDVGDEVLLDGRLTDGIKVDMLSDDLPLANWIVRKGTDAEEEVAEDTEKKRRKNSKSSSTSDSENTAPSRMRSVESAS